MCSGRGTLASYLIGGWIVLKRGYQTILNANPDVELRSVQIAFLRELAGE